MKMAWVLQKNLMLTIYFGFKQKATRNNKKLKKRRKMKNNLYQDHRLQQQKNQRVILIKTSRCSVLES